MLRSGDVNSHILQIYLFHLIRHIHTITLTFICLLYYLLFGANLFYVSSKFDYNFVQSAAEVQTSSEFMLLPESSPHAKRRQWVAITVNVYNFVFLSDTCFCAKVDTVIGKCVRIKTT